MPRNGKPVVIYLENGMAQWLQEIKDMEEIPKSVVIRKALREFKARKEGEKNGK